MNRSRRAGLIRCLNIRGPLLRAAASSSKCRANCAIRMFDVPPASATFEKWQTQELYPSSHLGSSATLHRREMMKRLIWIALMSAAFSMACSTNKGSTGDNKQNPESSPSTSSQSAPSSSDQSASPNSSATGQPGSAESGSSGASSSDTSGSSASGNAATSDTGSSKAGTSGSPSSNPSTHKHRRGATQPSTTPQ